MQVILLEKVQNLGELGDAVNVKAGFARNFLIPQGKAALATPQNLAEFEAHRAELERQQAEALATAQARAAGLEGLVLTVTRKAGDEGKLFGSVGTADIAEAAEAAGVDVKRSEVRLPEDSLRQTGEYEIKVHLHPDVDGAITLRIEAEP